MKIYLLFFCVVLFLSCNKQENPSNETDEGKTDMIRGKIVGCIICREPETENPLFGICIISTNKDSILSFNVPPSILGLPYNETSYGVSELPNGDSVQFNFRSAEEGEIKQFDCPPSIEILPSSNIPLLDFNQVVITDINKIK